MAFVFNQGPELHMAPITIESMYRNSIGANSFSPYSEKGSVKSVDDVETPSDEYTRSATGVYQNKNAEIDWTRSIDPTRYRRNALRMVDNSYNRDRALLRKMWNGHMNVDQTRKYWETNRAIRQARRLGRAEARDAAKDYYDQYNNYVYGQIGQLPTLGSPNATPVKTPTTDVEIKPYFKYTEGRFKNGGKVLKGQQAIPGGMPYPYDYGYRKIFK